MDTVNGLATPATQEDMDRMTGLIVSEDAQEALVRAFAHSLSNGQEAMVSFLNCMDRLKGNRFFDRASRCTLYLDSYTKQEPIPGFYWVREVRQYEAETQAWEWKFAMNGGFLWSRYSLDWSLHT